MQPIFSLYRSHLDLAHWFWKTLCRTHDWVIDATCGNGRDALVLSRLLPKGGLICLDIQGEALEKTKTLLNSQVTSPSLYFFLQSHATFPQIAYSHPIRLIVYNLGYLPGGNKLKTTLTDSTLQSIKAAQELLAPGGVISITCYPGHHEGLKEKNALLDTLSSTKDSGWSFSHIEWFSSPSAPSLIILQKAELI